MKLRFSIALCVMRAMALGRIREKQKEKMRSLVPTCGQKKKRDNRLDTAQLSTAQMPRYKKYLDKNQFNRIISIAINIIWYLFTIM